MKTSAIKKLREKLAADKPVYGLWVTLESASVTEMAVALGMDWVLIDAEHGHLDWKDILEHVRATVRSDTVALVRISELNIAAIKRVLDIGADGVVIPWIETAEQLRQAVAFARFPLEGLRGIGAERATGWGQCFVAHTQEANDHVLVIPMIESVAAGRNIKELCQVQGSEIFLIGPADYSSSAGHRGHWEGPGIGPQLQMIKDTVRASGRQCGIITTSEENLIERRQQGFRVLALGTDTGLLLRSIHSALGIVGRDRAMTPALLPADGILPPTPLKKPPESFRPERMEALSKAGQRTPIELAPGVALDGQVGAFNGAKGLSTSRVTFQPGGALPYHTHPVSESITVLFGSFVVEVEGRAYSLGLLDNLVIPRGLAHTTRNASASETGLVHAAMASESPTRELVPNTFQSQPMPVDATGSPGKERLTRFASAARSSAGPGTSFIDHLNKDLLPGIEMSGGYGLFEPGGRLPAHFHDFDESISIIQGSASCIVEGRRYEMPAGSTALQPRGRVHYFVNESKEPMAMLWVYGGPSPDRLVVDERCATAEGNPWK